MFSAFIPNPNEYKPFDIDQREKLKFERKSSSLLLETDRAVYKPGQTGKN